MNERSASPIAAATTLEPLATLMAMQGLLASGHHEGTAPNELARLARAYAEAVVKLP